MKTILEKFIRYSFRYKLRILVVGNFGTYLLKVKSTLLQLIEQTEPHPIK